MLLALSSSVAIISLFQPQTTDDFGTPPAPLTLEGEEGCSLETNSVCKRVGVVTRETAIAHLGDAPQTYWLDEDGLHVAVRRPTEIDQVLLCCSIQTEMESLGDGVWVSSFLVSRLEEAVLGFWPLPPADPRGSRFEDRPIFRGPAARPAPPRDPVPDARIENIMIPTRTFGTDRFVTIYTPAGSPPQGGWPTIFVADGGRVNEFAPVVEAMAAQCRAMPLLMIGLWPGEEYGAPTVEGVEGIAADARSREYLWRVHPSSFNLHQDWLINELVPLAVERGGSSTRDERMTFGASSGAAWALSTGLLHPETFGYVAGASLGWRPSLDAAPVHPDLQIFVASGYFEETFNQHSRDVIAALRDQGASAEFMELMSGHAPIGFEMAFESALERAFPATDDCVPTAPSP